MLGRSPGGGHGNPLQYSCLENLHGQRSLAGYSPQGCKESDMTEATEHACMHNWPFRHGRIQEACSPEEGLHLAMLEPHSGLPNSRTMRNKCFLFISHLVCGVFLQQPEETKTDLFIMSNSATNALFSCNSSLPFYRL